MVLAEFQLLFLVPKWLFKEQVIPKQRVCQGVNSGILFSLSTVQKQPIMPSARHLMIGISISTQNTNTLTLQCF